MECTICWLSGAVGWHIPSVGAGSGTSARYGGGGLVTLVPLPSVGREMASGTYHLPGMGWGRGGTYHLLYMGGIWLHASSVRYGQGRGSSVVQTIC